MLQTSVQLLLLTPRQWRSPRTVEWTRLLSAGWAIRRRDDNMIQGTAACFMSPRAPGGRTLKRNCVVQHDRMLLLALQNPKQTFDCAIYQCFGAAPLSVWLEDKNACVHAGTRKIPFITGWALLRCDLTWITVLKSAASLPSLPVFFRIWDVFYLSICILCSLCAVHFFHLLFRFLMYSNCLFCLLKT